MVIIQLIILLKGISLFSIIEDKHLTIAFRSLSCNTMKTFAVAEVRAHLSSLLKEVESGNEIGITFGRKKEPIAVIIPINEYKRIKPRKLGTLEGKVSIEFKGEWSLSDEEFLKS